MGRGRQVSSLAVRPYHLLCAICSLGGDGAVAGRKGAKRILDAVRKNPDAPIMVACNAGHAYVYQDPGTSDDTPEGADFNRKRDLDILQKLDLPPGGVLPARILFKRLLDRIPTVCGICGYDTVTGDAWKGCPKAKSGDYERGRGKGIAALIASRSEKDLAQEKEASLKALCATQEVKVRPHILLCAVCQYGGGTRPPFKPDNLPELLQMVLRKDCDLVVKLVSGADWLMCAPCPSRVVEMNACVCGPISSGGLYNELKDLNVLQKLGLTCGATMKARDLFKLIFERIPSATKVCALDNGDKPANSFWWDPCGAKEPPTNYEKGREMLMAEFG